MIYKNIKSVLFILNITGKVFLKKVNMKKITKKKQEYKEKIKTKASKDQLAKFKDCFETKCDNPNKDKMNKTIKNLIEQKPDES